MGWSDKWEIEIIPAPKPTFSQQLREQNQIVDKWIKEISKEFENITDTHIIQL